MRIRDEMEAADLILAWTRPSLIFFPGLKRSTVKVEEFPALEANTDCSPSPSSPTTADISQVCEEHWHTSDPKLHSPLVLVTLHIGAFLSKTFREK